MTRTQAATPLRRRMLDDMRLRNLAAGTRQIYVRSVAGFSAFHGRSPDQLTLEDVRDYQLHLVARGLKASTICQISSARIQRSATAPSMRATSSGERMAGSGAALRGSGMRAACSGRSRVTA